MSTGEKAFAATWALIMAPAAILSEGFVLAKLWGWFVIPTFNLPGLTINTAIGIALLWGAISIKKRDYWPPDDDSKEELSQKLTKTTIPALAPWFIMLAAWIVLAFK